MLSRTLTAPSPYGSVAIIKIYPGDEKVFCEIGRIKSKNYKRIIAIVCCEDFSLKWDCFQDALERHLDDIEVAFCVEKELAQDKRVLETLKEAALKGVRKGVVQMVCDDLASAYRWAGIPIEHESFNICSSRIG
jgi:hypothetical protein